MSKITTAVSKEDIIKASEAQLTGEESFYNDFKGYLLSPEDMTSFRKSSSFANTNQPWGELYIKSPKSYGFLIGNAAPLTEKDKAPTLEEFYEHTKNVFHNRVRGWEWSSVRNGEEWIPYNLRRAKEWYDYRPVKVDKATAFTEVFLRIMVQSWEGLLSEMIVKIIVSENLRKIEEYANYPEDTLELRNPTKEQDNRLNCDIIVWNTRRDCVEFAIQIKPFKYFPISDKTKGDKLKNRGKDLTVEEVMGANVYYLDKTKVLDGQPIHFIKSESVVSPYEDDYKQSRDRGFLLTIGQNSVGEFRKQRIKSPYYGY